MNYRTFGRTGWQVSRLGLGCMRLPTLGRDEEVDEPHAIRLIRRAIDGGINYVDTAWGYHGGNSERVLGTALADGYRAKVKLVTKLPSWRIKQASDFDAHLDEQLARLRTDHIDLYLLHTLDKKNWSTLRDLDVLAWADRAIASGRFSYLGFSFHDEYDVFTEIVDAWDRWTACMVQYNYLFTETQAGTRGVRYAAGKGLAVVAMEPVFGGNLASPPPPIRAVMNRGAVKRSPVDWALQWVADQAEINVVLSGMSTEEQVEQNLASADRLVPGAFSIDDARLVEEVAATYRKLQPIPCTRCNYCMPCPSGVEIPHNLWLFNNAVMYGRLPQMREEYRDTKPEARASACTDCDQCEEKCPQKIAISDCMPRIDTELSSSGSGQRNR